MKENTGPVATIGQNNLNALSNILYFYERWLWNTLAPSIKRSKQITEVQLLLVKVSLLGSSKIAPLTFDEAEYINSAIKVFEQHVRKKIPQSKDRDEVLTSCEGLRSYIVTTFTPVKKKTPG